MSFHSIGVGFIEKKLYTPGPLNTHADTKAQMQCDYGSRDKDFVKCIANIRKSLVSFADLPPDKFTCVLMQGAGTMSVEAVIGTTVPPDGKILICTNGAYGDRIGLISETLGIDTVSSLKKKPTLNPLKSKNLTKTSVLIIFFRLFTRMLNWNLQM